MADDEDHQTIFLARKLQENDEGKLAAALSNIQLMYEDDPISAGWLVANAIQRAQHTPDVRITSTLVFEILGAAWLATDSVNDEAVFAHRMINGSCLVSGEGCPEAQGLRLVLKGVDYEMLPKLRRFITQATSELSTMLSPTIRVAAHACVKVMRGRELQELFK